jgi:hypothetical protein
MDNKSPDPDGNLGNQAVNAGGIVLLKTWCSEPRQDPLQIWFEKKWGNPSFRVVGFQKSNPVTFAVTGAFPFY